MSVGGFIGTKIATKYIKKRREDLVTELKKQDIDEETINRLRPYLNDVVQYSGAITYFMLGMMLLFIFAFLAFAKWALFTYSGEGGMIITIMGIIGIAVAVVGLYGIYTTYKIMTEARAFKRQLKYHPEDISDVNPAQRFPTLASKSRVLFDWTSAIDEN